MGSRQLRVDLPGVDAQLTEEIERRIDEFEREHEPAVLRDGPGWVPRIRRTDYLIAIAVNAVIVIWLIVVLVGG